MSDITANVVVGNALQLFTSARAFRSLANGRIYVGEPDTDPTIPSNQKVVYLSNENGDIIPMQQPLIINAGGHVVYNGQLARKITTDGNYSMAIYDAYGSLEYYFDDMARIDPDVLLSMISGKGGAGVVGYGESTVSDALYHTPEEFFVGSMDDAYSSTFEASASDGRRAFIKGVKNVTRTFSIPENTIIQHDGNTNSSQSGTGTGEERDFLFTLNNNNRLIGGSIVNIGKLGVATARNKSNIIICDVNATGSVEPDNPFAYAYDLRNSKNITVRGGILKKYTGAISMISCEKVIIDSLSMADMYYHESIDAGGYGVVLGGCNDVTIINNNFKALDGDNGRHAIYLSTQGGGGNTNVLISNNIFDWRNKSDAFRGGAVNVRSSVRTIICNNVFDGTTITGITNSGTITNCDIIGNTIRAWIYENQLTQYGITLGEDTDSYFVDGGVVANNSVVVLNKTGEATGTVYGINMSGKNRRCVGNMIEVPVLGYPIRVSPGAKNITISDNIDKSSSHEGQAFILFDGPCSDITVTGNKTSRPMFRNITNCTDLTVDFPRYCQIVVNSGVVTISSDDYSLISGTEVNGYGIIINFNSHVTQAALDTAIALNTLNFTPPSTPVIAARGTKNLNIRFYNSSGALINPITGNIAVRVQINS